MSDRATFYIALAALFVAVVAWRKADALERGRFPLAVQSGERQT